MKKMKVLALCAMIAGCITSCQKGDLTNVAPPQQTEEPTKEQLDKLYKMGINTDEVTIQEFPLPDGSKEKYLVSGDITIPIGQLGEYVDADSQNGNEKQWRSEYLVAPQHRNIRVLGWTGGSFALTSKMRTALSWALYNYNALPNSLNFTLSFGTNQSNADIVVYKINNPNGGANAGFPTSNGKPYRYVRFNSGMDKPIYSTNVNEHVMTHEIGHCIGFRHQDWFNRQSCGYSGPLPAEPPAIWVPGTPWSWTEDSVMQACFGLGEDGELSPSDKTALNILY